jgi:tetratricopeptide (TPR) repeat protein
MNIDTAINWLDRAIAIETGTHLSDLQIFIVSQVYLSRKYVEIAADYHCTEGHVKDTAAALWQLLTQLFGERVTKTNLKSILQRQLNAPRSAPKTIVVGGASPLENRQFIGRESAIASLDELIHQGQRTIAIVGEGGIGKTTLAQQYLKTAGCDLVLELVMAKELSQITPAAIVVEEWLRQDLQCEPGREFSISLLRLKRQLSSRKIGVLIDNLEPVLNQNGQIVVDRCDYLELLRVLTDRQLLGITLITSRDRLCEIDLNLNHYRLSGLDLQTWQTYFSYRQIDATATELAPLHHSYGGNAKAMEIIAGNIQADFASNIAIYIRSDRSLQSVEIGLKQLISNQFDRLKSLDPDAYRLLCRAGCYRYQDLNRVNADALLCLLWEIEPSHRIKVLSALNNRSLIESNCGRYWLHPAIRAEAIARLQSTEDWITAHHVAAHYWTDLVPKIIDTQTAITALEAYYHYVEIGDLSQAAQVLLQPSNNQWGQFLPLASNLYRMGLIQPALMAIERVIPALPPVGGASPLENRDRAELQNILGDLYWIIGRVQQAISTQQRTLDYTTSALSIIDRANRSHHTHCLQILQIDSLLSIGLYHIDLCELARASELFDRVITLAKNTTGDRWVQKATICLALVQSELNHLDRARQLLGEILPLTDRQKLTGSSAFFLQIIGQTYTNLGEYDLARSIYQQTLTFCKTGNYLQIQGRTLTGLAQLDRLQDQLLTAQTHHLQAIDMLDRIGAKCDLAAAYYQAGLTWYQAGDLTQSQIYSELHARKLFTEIAAPQQLAKLKSIV